MKTMSQVRNDKRVSHVYKDDDGYWIDLAEGYADMMFDPFQPCGTIREDSWADAVFRMSGVRAKADAQSTSEE